MGNSKMTISIFGMGYVGSVTAACLIKQGHKVIGVDIVNSKIDKLNQGKWPIYEPGLNDLNSPELIKDNFFATTNEKLALSKSEVSLICVGTPSSSNGEIEFKYLKNVFNSIIKYFEKKPKEHSILIRSTIPPGTTHELISYVHKDIDKKLKIGFLPEFLREGSSISDFFSPSLKVIGCDDDFPLEILDKLFSEVKGKWIKTTFEIAESIKYISNTWHALKIVFTNEIASILKVSNADSEKAMEIFSKDKKLNISNSYMKPGFAYGGSCLPKDLSALINYARSLNINTPLLEAINTSNNEVINKLEFLLYKLNKKNIGFCGVSFKPNTDDTRNSPILAVLEKLISKKLSYQSNYKIIIIDNEYVLSKLKYKNHPSFIFKIKQQDLFDNSDLIILGPYMVKERLVIKALEDNKIIVDLKWHSLSKKIKMHDNYFSLV